ncbi:hypothetical protein Taro_043213 [Colocasia esculenta]|uniref:Secreted protein n=1 Tax=Colocasia esculenta TaxID=4460 RepID=A0A843X080_COLES|nr:hypothetical protein [Colocasia esculenta]
MKWCVSLCLHGLWCGIPCEASSRLREADSDQVRYQFNGLGRGVPPQLSRVIAVQGQYLQQCSPSSVVVVAAV